MLYMSAASRPKTSDMPKRNRRATTRSTNQDYKSHDHQTMRASSRRASSERHALGPQLRYPSADTILGLVVLVVLVQGQAQELPVLLALRLRVGVARGVHLA